MELEGIISIGGRPGLFKVVTKRKNELIVESIGDGKKHFIYALDHVSALEDISIYTDSDNIPLPEVYESLYAIEGGKNTIDHKSPAAVLKEKMIEILPDYDQERVYNSDLKKLFQWFNILINADLLKPEDKKEHENKKEPKVGDENQSE
jgi:hypothetical protein